jgi:hypothetical protein
MDRRRERGEGGAARRRLIRERFSGVNPETHHGFARPDVHQVLTECGFWLNEIDGDSSTYARRGAKDYVVTHRPSGSWRHVMAGVEVVEGSGGRSLSKHLQESHSSCL